TDTVGFIRKLPHHLIKAFRSTLDEASYADALMIVLDVSDPEHLAQLEVTERLLEELGAAGKPTLYVFNKCDLGAVGLAQMGMPAVRENTVSVSARKGQVIGLLFDKMQELMQSQYSLQLIEKQIEYSALQSQINPHFLYNTLEAIRSQALLNNQTEIALMTEKLARFFRYCISNREDIVTIRDEINNIRDYFFIQQYRFENRFSLEIIYNEEDDSFDKVIPKMTLQPVVENAIFHGLEQKKGSGTVTIRILQTRSKIYIVISDDGVGMQEEQVLSMNQRLQNLGIKADETVSYRKGIALSNVNNRLKLYFGEEYGLRISSIIGQGTDVEICIPGRELREVQRRM
ncbi:MAG: histidine kinase, partial [Lachnospiraceae bacterium]|nr:histidine kinase [Lachnospiraceae bacterium]